MVRMVSCLVLVASMCALHARAEEVEGVRWEADLDAGLARAAREGRPVLFAINALENEGANRRLRYELYPSAPWGAATRPYVNFVCNPDTHAVESGGCDHYGPIPCTAHQAALRYVLRRFDPVSGSLISPQHLVLEPDGDLAYRKEYFTNVVGPRLLDRLWVGISPDLAYGRAGETRRDKIDALDAAPKGEIVERARAWLRSGDTLAAAGILCALDYSFDRSRRLLLLAALDATPSAQLPVVDLLADEFGARPDDRPDEAMALAVALLGSDRPTGLRLLARIAARTQDEKLQKKAWGTWHSGAQEGSQAVADAELAARAELALLTGIDTRAAMPGEGRLSALWKDRLARARRIAGRHTVGEAGLKAAIEDGRPGRLRKALLAATPDEVRKNAAGVRAALRERPEARVRYAAAIALMGAGLDEGGHVAPMVLLAVQDPIEGPEARGEAVRRLGVDPGWNEQVWIDAVRKAVGGAR